MAFSLENGGFSVTEPARKTRGIFEIIRCIKRTMIQCWGIFLVFMGILNNNITLFNKSVKEK